MSFAMLFLLVNLIMAFATLKFTSDLWLGIVFAVSIGEIFLFCYNGCTSLFAAATITQLAWCFTLKAKLKTSERLFAENNFLQEQIAKNASIFNEIKAMALGDALTGISNRRNFDMVLKAEIKKAAAFNTPLSLIIFDIDSFKSYNDTYGHLEGDRLLHAIGALLKPMMNASVFPARYGGEEFAVILSGANLAKATDFAEELRRTVASLKNVCAPITASFGASSYSPSALTAPPSSETMISVADKSLYRAKRSGKNCVFGSNIL
jgi:diguanylate cyclase (GGDEF)-like protein